MNDESKNPADLLRFPQSRTQPKATQGGFKDLGLSEMAQKSGDTAHLRGHWCSRCKGIWFGYSGECECPVCGNRNG